MEPRHSTLQVATSPTDDDSSVVNAPTGTPWSTGSQQTSAAAPRRRWKCRVDTSTVDLPSPIVLFPCPVLRDPSLCRGAAEIIIQRCYLGIGSTSETSSKVKCTDWVTVNRGLPIRRPAKFCEAPALSCNCVSSFFLSLWLYGSWRTYVASSGGCPTLFYDTWLHSLDGGIGLSQDLYL
jgi:hypothetical protein